MELTFAQYSVTQQMKNITAEILPNSQIEKIQLTDSVFQFKRLEKKYLLNSFQAELLIGQVGFYIPLDKKSTENPFISSIYFDNAEWKCFNAQIEKQNPRFKLRLRQYGENENDVRRRFLEIKRKNNSISYKERLNIHLPDSKSATDFLLDYVRTSNMKIKVDSINDVYHKIRNVIQDNRLEPVVQVSYKRIAFENQDRTLRITFDTGLNFQSFPALFNRSVFTNHEMPDDFFIMEIKYKGKIPVWLKRLLKLNNIQRQRFSKYCKAIKSIYDLETNSDITINSVGHSGTYKYGHIKSIINDTVRVQLA